MRHKSEIGARTTHASVYDLLSEFARSYNEGASLQRHHTPSLKKTARTISETQQTFGAIARLVFQK